MIDYDINRSWLRIIDIDNNAIWTVGIVVDNSNCRCQLFNVNSACHTAAHGWVIEGVWTSQYRDKTGSVCLCCMWKQSQDVTGCVCVSNVNRDTSPHHKTLLACCCNLNWTVLMSLSMSDRTNSRPSRPTVAQPQKLSSILSIYLSLYRWL